MMASFLFGLIGLAMFMYGRKSARLVPLGTGVALMIVPYFLSNFVVMLIVCGGLSAVPLLVRE